MNEPERPTAQPSRPPSLWLRISRTPGLVALLWAVAALLAIAGAVVFPGDDHPRVSTTLYLTGACVFSGLMVAWVLRLGAATFNLLGALLIVSLLASLAGFALKAVTPPDVATGIDTAIAALSALAAALLVFFVYGASRSRVRRLAAIAVGIGVSLAAAGIPRMDWAFFRLSENIQTALGRAPQAADTLPPDIDDDILWGAQPGLIDKARAAFQPRAPGRANVYAMAVAGSGEQALFSREAREALRVAALHFGDRDRGGALLSNGAVDQMHSPLATRANIAAIAEAAGEKADHQHDLLFVYLVSHGGKTAELESDLPNYRDVQPISSISTAQALKAAGVARRIVIVSACYSGAWIPALADDNTIVITAAAKDRTSFGCDDTRRFTVFGEAFLGSLAAPGISLHDAFEDAKRKITAEEQKEKVTPSLPQVFVGRNMQELWMGGRAK